MLLEGRLRLTLSRMKPFPAKAALAYIFHMHELEGGFNPPALAYTPLFLLRRLRSRRQGTRDQQRISTPFTPICLRVLYWSCFIVLCQVVKCML